MQDTIHKTISLILEKEKNIKYGDDISLFRGICGEILMYYELYDYYGSTVLKKKSDELIDKLLRSVSNCSKINFFEGYAGLLYTLAYLTNRQFLDTNSEVFEIFDKHFEKFVCLSTKRENYDLLIGIIGIGIYYIERNKRKHNKSAFIFSIIDSLIALSVKLNDTLFWLYHHEHDKKNGDSIVNLGFLHGMPSILAFFIICYKEGYVVEHLTEVIHKGMSFLNRYVSNPDFVSFPYYVNIDNDHRHFTNKTTKLGYCYGDLSLIHLYYQAASIFDRSDYAETADKIILKKLPQVLYNDEGDNPYFCHGLSGIIFLYHCLCKSQKTCDLNTEAKLITRLKIDYIDNKNIHFSQGILNGYTGIVLSLVSLLKPTCLERILLLK